MGCAVQPQVVGLSLAVGGWALERLHQQWPMIDPTRLDDAALDLWWDERLRAMAPDQAAEDWLRPVMAEET